VENVEIRRRSGKVIEKANAELGKFVSWGESECFQLFIMPLITLKIRILCLFLVSTTGV